MILQYLFTTWNQGLSIDIKWAMWAMRKTGPNLARLPRDDDDVDEVDEVGALIYDQAMRRRNLQHRHNGKSKTCR